MVNEILHMNEWGNPRIVEEELSAVKAAKESLRTPVTRWPSLDASGLVNGGDEAAGALNCPDRNGVQIIPCCDGHLHKPLRCYPSIGVRSLAFVGVVISFFLSSASEPELPSLPTPSRGSWPRPAPPCHLALRSLDGNDATPHGPQLSYEVLLRISPIWLCSGLALSCLASEFPQLTPPFVCRKGLLIYSSRLRIGLVRVMFQSVNRVGHGWVRRPKTRTDCIMSDNTKEYMDSRELAEWLGISVRTVVNLRLRRALPYIKFGRVVRFKREAVEEALKEYTVSGIVSAPKHDGWRS